MCEPQVGDPDPGRDQDPRVVDHEREVLLAQLRRPSDEVVARGELPGGGGEAECYSARKFDADRHANPLRYLDSRGQIWGIISNGHIPVRVKDGPCEFCDSPGGEVTYRHQVCMPLGGRVQCIDFCIHQIVAALNAGGVRTIASCCGHGKMKGNIILEDGRVLLIQQKPETMNAWKEGVAI